MDSRVIGLRVAAGVFALVSLAQLLRLLFRPEILVAGYLLPLWPSVLAVLIAGALCAWMWKLSLPTKPV